MSLPTIILGTLFTAVIVAAVTLPFWPYLFAIVRFFRGDYPYKDWKKK